MADLTRKQLVVGSLFYPAFLGNMTYLAAERLFDAPAFYGWANTLIVVALLLHFVADWLYTMTEVVGSTPPSGHQSSASHSRRMAALRSLTHCC
jgi:hypothetical protein